MTWAIEKRVFLTVARPLKYESNPGASTFEFRGVVLDPSPEELAGGMPVSMRTVIAMASSFTEQGATPTQYDRVFDPADSNREYSVDWEPVALYNGSSRKWWRIRVQG